LTCPLLQWHKPYEGVREDLDLTIACLYFLKFISSFSLFWETLKLKLKDFVCINNAENSDMGCTLSDLHDFTIVLNDLHDFTKKI
jgi:hypothetical protein